MLSGCSHTADAGGCGIPRREDDKLVEGTIDNQGKNDER
jgi:hypothetical protein